MSDTNEVVTTPDRQRAAALVIHHNRADVDGMAAVLTEAAEEGRISHLISSLLGLYQLLIPELRTPEGAQRVCPDFG